MIRGPGRNRLTSNTNIKVKTTDMVARGKVTLSSPTSHCRSKEIHLILFVVKDKKENYGTIKNIDVTLTDSRTDCAKTNTAMPRLKKGC